MSQNPITAPFSPDEDFPYIFISYAHVDRERVFPIIKRIYEAGWKVWYDEGLELGGDYYKSLKSHIINCAVFLLFLSENSLKSDFITQNEIPLADEYQKTTVVLDLDGGLGEKYEGNYDLMTDAESVESALSEIEFLEKGPSRKALGHVITENVIRQCRDSLYKCEKCRGGVRLTECSDTSTELVIPEYYPYLSGQRVVDISKSMFWKHTELVSVRLPSALKSIDLIVFLNNRSLKHLYVPSGVKLTNNLDTDLSKLSFTIHSAEGSHAQKFAKKNAMSFVVDNTLVSDNSDAEAYAYASFAYGEATVSFGALMILKESNCRYVMGGMGSPSKKKTEEMIKNSACFVAFVNKAYIAGNYIDDLRLALSYSKPVAIWQLEDCTLPEDLEKLQDIHQLRYNTGTDDEREIKLINWLTKNNCRDPYEIKGYEYRCTVKGIEITGYNGSSACIAPPAYHCGIPVVSISGASRCEHVVSVRLPETLRSVNSFAFRDCIALREAVLGAGVRELGSHAFEGCVKLKSVTLPDGMLRIGERAFMGCSALTDISLPEGMLSVGAGAFEGCAKLKTVTLPASLERTGLNPFKGCSALKEIRILGMDTKLFMTGNELKNMTVYCVKGSAMQKMFEKAGIPYKLIK